MSNSLLWIEKYRPQNLQDIKSQNNIVNSIEKFLINKNLPHLLFFGSSGTGKTSCIHAACKKLYGENNYKFMILELNASDNRGIDTVRKQIYEFANTSSLINKGIKTIILDEADSMTIMAQNALRKIIENNSDNVRFCIICNYINNIIPALKSRCIQFRFSPLKNNDKKEILKKILKNENFNFSNDNCLDIIIKIANGDMRKSINMLQSLSIIYKNTQPDKNDIYNYFNIISEDDLEKIWEIIRNDKENLKNKNDLLEKIILEENDYNLIELIQHFTDRILKKEKFNNEQLMFIFKNFANLEETLMFDYIPEIVLSSLISILNKVNDIK